jgi:hypothetical protein
MGLAVIRNDAIEIYNLPPLSKKDQADVKEARTLIPQENVLPIEFAGPTAEPADQPAAQPADQPVNQPAIAQPAPANSTAASMATGPASSDATRPASAPAATAPAAAPPAPASSATVGDTVPEKPRKPPTLYTLPGDKDRGGADEGTK